MGFFIICVNETLKDKTVHLQPTAYVNYSLLVNSFFTNLNFSQTIFTVLYPPESTVW